MTGKLFGTDGVRGKANVHPIIPETVMKIGRAAAHLLARHSAAPCIVIGKDTRISGDMLEHAIASGVCSAGTDAVLGGVLPTPGIAFLTRNLGARAGFVVSASHNPFPDNGIKIFGARGYKLSDDTEKNIEEIVSSGGFAFPDKPGRVVPMDDAETRYAAYLRGTLPGHLSLRGLRVALDCAHGATYRVGPAVLSALGAEVFPLCVTPDGANINAGCGSQHPERLQEEVLLRGAHLGCAFDGDGDRLIAVDEKGKLLTGDQILAVIARYMLEEGRLSQSTVVSTVMSNLGLRLALERMGIRHIASPVGDRYVLEAMQSSGAILGGEDSGHILFLERHTTGDGILTALQLIEVMLARQRPLSELARVMEVFPQVLLNVEVHRKPELASVPAVAEAIRSVEARLGGRGRILVRYSGTRPLCRVMVEGPTEGEVQSSAQHIADTVRFELGQP
ncbi:phosphoglucosamine mutase [Thermodesulfobacteriota bacterium]